MQPFLNVQPFRCIVDIPCRLYTGVIPADQTLYYLALQLAWALIFIYLGMLAMRKAMKRAVIQGG
jgi:ABC-2 type transport system permease protein